MSASYVQLVIEKIKTVELHAQILLALISGIEIKNCSFSSKKSYKSVFFFEKATIIVKLEKITTHRCRTYIKIKTINLTT